MNRDQALPGVESEAPKQEVRAARGYLTVAGLLAVVAGIGWFEHALGPGLRFWFFYLLPVVAAGWWAGPVAAVSLAVAASLARLLAELGGAPPHVVAWNTFGGLAAYAALGLLGARARRDREHLQVLLERETTLARTDQITNLPNYRGFVERLLTETSRSRRAARPICIAYMDIDNFKSVNDRHGHAAGDDLLRRIAGAIRDTIRSSDVPARLGGDEFAVLFWEVEPEAVEGIIHRLIDRIREVGRAYPEAGVAASVGIAYFMAAPDSAEEILRRADDAMYKAKSGGKGKIALWSSDLPAQAVLRHR